MLWKSSLLLLLVLSVSSCAAFSSQRPALLQRSPQLIPREIVAARSTTTIQSKPLYSGKREPTSSQEGLAYPPVYLPIGIVGTAANFVCFYSLYVLYTTGSGLEGFGPGLAEGLSYLVVVGVFGWSAFTKLTTGEGLPGNPFVLGLAEGLAYLTVVGGLFIEYLKLQGV